MAFQKGDIVWIKGQGGKRSSDGVQDFDHPGIVIQNDIGNEYGQTVIVCLGTSVIKNESQKTHFIIESDCLQYKTMFMTEQIYTCNTRYITYLGKLNFDQYRTLNNALCVSLDLGKALEYFKNKPIENQERKEMYIPNTGMYNELNYINSLIDNFSGIDSIDTNELVDTYIKKQLNVLYEKKDKTKEDIRKIIWYLNRMLKSPKLK